MVEGHSTNHVNKTKNSKSNRFIKNDEDDKRKANNIRISKENVPRGIGKIAGHRTNKIPESMKINYFYRKESQRQTYKKHKFEKNKSNRKNGKRGFFPTCASNLFI